MKLNFFDFSQRLLVGRELYVLEFLGRVCIVFNELIKRRFFNFYDLHRRIDSLVDVGEVADCANLKLIICVSCPYLIDLAVVVSTAARK